MPASTTSTSSADDHNAEREAKHHVVEKSSSSSFVSTSLIVPQHELDNEPRDDAAHSDDESDIAVDVCPASSCDSTTSHNDDEVAAKPAIPQEERRRFKPLLLRRLSEPVFPSLSKSSPSRPSRRSMDDSNTTTGGGKKSVRFGGCLVRSYSQVLGDHPCCSTGCPLSLGWEYEESPEIKVEEYEALTSPTSSAGARSRLSDLRLTWDERRAILHSMSDEFIKRHCRQWSRQQAKICSFKQQTSKQRSIQQTFFGGDGMDAKRVVVDPEDKVVGGAMEEENVTPTTSSELQQNQQQ